MKILHIINNLGSGGAEKLLESSVPEINKSNDINANILLLTDRKNVFYDSLISKGINIEIIKYKNMYDPRIIFEISKIIKKNNYNIVHSHVFPTQYWVALASLLVNNNEVKFTTTEHNTNNKRRNKSIFRYIEKFMYSRYDSIISITQEVKNKLIEWTDKNEKNSKKHIIIENGVNIEEIENALPYNKHSLIDSESDDVKIVCMVGSFSSQKDQPTLIKAMNKLPENIELILLGQGPLEKENKELVKKLGLENRAHFLGFRSDVYRILKTSDIIVLSSYYEGLSIAALEALAVGKPFIASRVPGLEKLVTDYGLVFEQGNDLELSNLIVKLLNNKELYDETVKKCCMRANDYSIEKMNQKLIEEYKRLLKK